MRPIRLIRFTLEKRNDKLKLEEIEGYGETSVRNLFAAIRERREISLERFIYALGIRHVGETTARALSPVEGTQSPPMKFSRVRTVTAMGRPYLF